MKTFLASIIPKVQQFSEKLDNEALLTSKHWVVIDDTGTANFVYIFRPNSDLLVSHNGKVQKGSWEYIDNHSIYTEIGDEKRLFKHGFFDENVLALKVDNGNKFAFLVNEPVFDSGLCSLNSVLTSLEMKLLREEKRILEEPERTPITSEKYHRDIRSRFDVIFSILFVILLIIIVLAVM